MGVDVDMLYREGGDVFAKLLERPLNYVYDYDYLLSLSVTNYQCFAGKLENTLLV